MMLLLLGGILYWLLLFLIQYEQWNSPPHPERAGGSKPQPAQVIQAPPPPSVSQTASESLEAQLKYNPQLTAQQVALQGQYAPQLAQQQLDLASQYGPMYQALVTQMFPQLGQLGQQISQGLTSPFGLSPEQQAAQDAIRQRSRDAYSQQIRERANLGGTLFGGRAQEQESRGLQELEQGFTAQDIALQGQNRDRVLRELVTYLQSASPNFQQPGVPQYGQSVVPGGDNLYNALVQNQGNFGVVPGTPGSPGFLGSFLQSFGCHVAEVLYGGDDIRTWLARYYVWTHNTLFTRLYRGFSDVWASWLKRTPFLQRIVRPLWDRMWKKQLAELRS